MSGVFSIASHWGLQYLPDVVMHEQTGCAHFWPLVVAICFLLDAVPHRVIPNGMLDVGKKLLCPIRDTLRCFGSHPKKNQSVGVECRRTLSYKEQFPSSRSAIVQAETFLRVYCGCLRRS